MADRAYNLLQEKEFAAEQLSADWLKSAEY